MPRGGLPTLRALCFTLFTATSLPHPPFPPSSIIFLHLEILLWGYMTCQPYRSLGERSELPQLGLPVWAPAESEFGVLGLKI